MFHDVVDCFLDNFLASFFEFLNSKISNRS